MFFDFRRPEATPDNLHEVHKSSENVDTCIELSRFQGCWFDSVKSQSLGTSEGSGIATLATWPVQFCALCLGILDAKVGVLIVHGLLLLLGLVVRQVQSLKSAFARFDRASVAHLAELLVFAPELCRDGLVVVERLRVTRNLPIHLFHI